MRILWLVNRELPDIAHKEGLAVNSAQGWLIGLSNALVKDANLELIIMVTSTEIKRIAEGKVNGYRYIVIPQAIDKAKYDKSLSSKFAEYIRKVDPDIVHIMGSEFPQTYSMMQALEELKMIERAVISIQGIAAVYADHYCKELPHSLRKRNTLRDYLYKSSLIDDEQIYRTRGVYEILALKKAHHIIGRTDWDKACVEWFNPKANYHINNETLRPTFYEGIWSAEKCERHSIFFCQAGKPIKGFHWLLMALPILLNHYPDIRVYIAGGSGEKIIDINGTPRWKNTTYMNFLHRLIKETHLESYIVPCGDLNEQEMKERYLQSHVFVSASEIENSSNSVGEAMILGVPVVSSDVGGIKSLMVHEKEGLLYQKDAPYMLASSIKRIFDSDYFAEMLSSQARRRALVTHNAKKNVEQLFKIYSKVAYTTMKR